MPDIATLAVLAMNWNTIDTQTSSEQIGRKQVGESSCTNTIQYTIGQMQCNTNTDGTISHHTNPRVINDDNSKINYSLLGPRRE